MFKSLLIKRIDGFKVQGFGFEWAYVSKTFKTLPEAEKYAKETLKELKPKGLKSLDIYDTEKEGKKGIHNAMSGYVKTIKG